MSNNKNNLIKLALDDSNHELDLSISDWDDLNELFKLQDKNYNVYTLMKVGKGYLYLSYYR